jgi:alpha-mannosidase
LSIIVLHPCASFDSLATELTETEASELLSAWTAAFHPAVLHAAVCRTEPQIECHLPRWESATYPAYNLQNDIVIVPPCCEHFWSEEWSKQTESCLVVRNISDRDEIVEKAAADCGIKTAVSFYALALAKLLTELTAQSLHYIDHNNDAQLKAALYDAVRCQIDGDDESAQRSLKEAFDELSQMRDNYYPVQNYFLEIILVTENTAGAPLRKLLADNAGKETLNLFIDTAVLAALPQTQPETLAALKEVAEKGGVKFIAGSETQDSNALPLLDVADRLLETVSLYRELLNVSPVIYGQQKRGLTPVLPQLLHLCGFKGALHYAPLDGWKIDDSEQSKMIWQGVDGTNIDALIRYPVDASSAKSFFTAAVQLGETLNHDHAPTAVFALFPGQTSPFLEALRCMTAYTTSPGKFLDIEEYFENTAQSGGVKKFNFGDYPPCETAADAKTSITAAVERLTESAKNTLFTLLEHSPETKNVTKMLTGSDTLVNYLSFPRKVFDAAGNAVELPPLGVLTLEKKETGSVQDTAKTAPGIKNVLSFFRPKLSRGSSAALPLIRQHEDSLGKGSKRAVYLLENRYFQAKIDAATGMLRSIFTAKSRFNQLSRQTAFFDGTAYSISAADRISVTKNTPLIGELEITGRLVMPGGTLIARYCETVCIRKDSRLLDFSLQLLPENTNAADNNAVSYFAVRYAWNDNTFNLCGGINDAVLPVNTKRFTAPLFVDLRSVEQSLTFFSQGSALHRLSGSRQLDTCLDAAESPYRFAVGVNVKHPVPVSQAFLSGSENLSPLLQSADAYSAKGQHWFFQIESNTVVALHWEPVLTDGKAVALSVYLLETEGRRAHFALRMYRNPLQAAALNLLGGEIKALKTSGDAVLVDMHAFELLPLRIDFFPP